MSDYIGNWGVWRHSLKKKKNLLSFKKINKVGSMLEIRDFVKAIVASVSGVFHSLGSLEKANPLLSILT